MARMPLALIALLGAAAIAGAAADPPPAPLRPPVAAKEPHKTAIHGDTLVDDYFWLRHKGTPEVEAYLKSELAYSEAFMKPTEPLQQKLYSEMLARIQQTDTNVPALDRGSYYYSRTEEGKQYPIFARKKGSLAAPEEVILDVNALAQGKTFLAVGDMTVSPDGNLLAYAADETGYRQYTLHVKDLRSGQLGPESIERVTSAEWTEDGKTLVYSVEDPQTKRSFQVFRHTLGAARDEPLYQEKDERFGVEVWKSRDHKYLFLESGSHTTSEIRYLPADTGTAEMKVIAERVPDQQYDVDHRDGTFWIRTNDQGRNFRLVTAPASDPGRRNWKEVVPHRDDVMLSGHLLFRDFYVLLEREGGWPQVRITDFRTGQTHRIEFPEPAYQVNLSNNRAFDASVVRLTYQSPVTSTSVYDYDPATRQRTLLKQVAVLGGFDPARYRVEITNATAADGAQVPLWLLYRKDLK
ncbi:MAG TPA: oligopeptidase B, partial [Vicinamibacteria bacterium]|nr:oligopeptidase B [Vicinamibacteria bacterium]